MPEYLYAMSKRALFEAIRLRDVRGLKRLMSEGGALEVRDEEGDTPLHGAAFIRHPAMVKLLVGAGADVDATNARGMTPLCSSLAIGARRCPERDVVTIVETLLLAGARPTPTNTLSCPLVDAAGDGLALVVDRLLHHGAKVDVKSGTGWTPLLRAIANRRWDVAERLVAAGASLTKRTTFGAPLTLAEERGGEKAVARLRTAR